MTFKLSITDYGFRRVIVYDADNGMTFSKRLDDPDLLQSLATFLTSHGVDATEWLTTTGKPLMELLTSEAMNTPKDIQPGTCVFKNARGEWQRSNP